MDDLKEQLDRIETLLKVYIQKNDASMETLHKSFKMVCNGIMNLRDELSESTGTIVSPSFDLEYV